MKIKQAQQKTFETNQEALRATKTPCIIIVVFGNFFSPVGILYPKDEYKKVLKDNNYKTIYEPVRIVKSSRGVQLLRQTDRQPNRKWELYASVVFFNMRRLFVRFYFNQYRKITFILKIKLLC